MTNINAYEQEVLEAERVLEIAKQDLELKKDRLASKLLEETPLTEEAPSVKVKDEPVEKKAPSKGKK